MKIVHGAVDENVSAKTPLSMLIEGHTNWTLQLPYNGPVAYQGVVSYDQAGTGTNSMLYPAPNAAGLLVAVLTHGLLIESAKKDQKNKLQVAADEVLSPYKTVLEEFKNQELMQLALQNISPNVFTKLNDNSVYSDREIVINSTPSFLLTQDQKSIIINNSIVISLKGKAPEIIYKNNFRVISKANEAPDPSAFWTANSGEKLKEESGKLLAKSIEISLLGVIESYDVDKIPYQTIRYKEGVSEKIERAQILRQECDRILIRTLRGMLMSVPVSNNSEIQCDSVPRI